MRHHSCLKTLSALALSSLLFSAVSADADPLTALSDEFTSSRSFANWRMLHVVEHTPVPYIKLDIARTVPGNLTIVPKSSVWYMNQTGAMLFKTITGDFIVSAYVSTHHRGDPSSPPQNMFNSAGLIARDPASRSGRQNWVVCNVGMQQNTTGSEVKTTRNSVSQLHLEQGAAEGEVRIVRVGDTFTMLRKLQGEGEWRTLGSMRRPDLGRKLQVGIMCNGYQTPDLAAVIDYIRFATPSGPEDATRDLPSTKAK